MIKLFNLEFNKEKFKSILFDLIKKHSLKDQKLKILSNYLEKNRY